LGLEGQVAIVTGSGQGIGEATAKVNRKHTGIML
jgi:NAD(P)-dependent dehydrogenase (short-subunit alcohol dehydrogenase family)